MSNAFKSIAEHCHAYKGGDAKASLIQLSVTAGLFLLCCGAMMWEASRHSYYLVTTLMLPASFLMVRLFVIQHDCGHGSYFRTRRANDLLGRILSVFTLTPYEFWRTAHNLHHAASGNLSRRTVGSIETLTVAEYEAMTHRQRFAYRLYRNPVVLILFGTPFNTIVLQRLPPFTISKIDNFRAVARATAWRSIMLLNVAATVLYGLAVMLLGLHVLLAVYLPILVITSWIGGWLFYVQHQFEDTFWKRDGEGWNFNEAALHGSSYYDLPKILHWLTGNIGLHHIHHLCALIPNYRLQKCLEDRGELKSINRMTIRDSLRCLRWRLWDEDAGRMITFRDLKARRA
jgi:omega-6 fatty acid desaturase (delta-12 desaturase)